MNLRRTSQTLRSMFTLLVPSGFTTVTTAVAVGILPSTAPSAALLGPLTVFSTWHTAGASIFTITVKLKVTVIRFTRERCELDSGLGNALASAKLQTRKQAGFQCPGSSLKKCQKLSSKHVTRVPLDFIRRFRINRFNTSVSAEK